MVRGKKWMQTGVHASPCPSESRPKNRSMPSPHLSSRLLIRSIQGSLLILLKPRLRQGGRWYQFVCQACVQLCTAWHAVGMPLPSRNRSSKGGGKYTHLVHSPGSIDLLAACEPHRPRHRCHDLRTRMLRSRAYYHNSGSAAGHEIIAGSSMASTPPRRQK